MLKHNNYTIYPTETGIVEVSNRLSIGATTVDPGTGGLYVSGNIVVPTVTGTKIGTAAAQLIGFWNATPVVQPSTTGTTTGFTAGGGTATKDDSTYTGGVGSKAYTVGDIVLALKQAGIMAAS